LKISELDESRDGCNYSTVGVIVVVSSGSGQDTGNTVRPIVVRVGRWRRVRVSANVTNLPAITAESNKSHLIVDGMEEKKKEA
jgi:hypothetical protein